jgi:predicted metalloprotease with PDZ domain
MTCARLSVLGPLLLLVPDSPAQAPTPKDAPLVATATLGVVTRPATADEARDLGLQVDRCVRGQVVTEVAKESGAAKVGIGPGDVLLRLGKVDLFSGDDIADFLRASKPWQTVEAVVRRAPTAKDGQQEETVSLTLSSAVVEQPREPVFAWQFASLAQLPDALAKAKEQKRVVLVGLSGAET